MRATSEETVRQLAEYGVTMPRKSTSFGPKPATGLVLRTLDDSRGLNPGRPTESGLPAAGGTPNPLPMT